MRAQAAEEAAAEEAAYRAAHPEEFVDEAPPTDGFVDGTIGMQPVSEEVPVEEPATPLQPGESMDISDLMPGFSAEVVSTETTGEVAPQEFGAEITSTETPEA